MFDIKNGEDLTKLFCKSDVILLAAVIETFAKVSSEEYGINPLYCVSLSGYTYHSALKYTDIKLQTLQDKDKVLLIEKNIRGGTSSVMGDRYVESDEKKRYYIWIPLIYMVIRCLRCYFMMKLILKTIFV